MRKWIANFDYGKANLATIEIARETEKMFEERRSIEDFIGQFYYVPSRFHKDDPRYMTFDTADAALDWLIKRALDHEAVLHQKAHKVRDEINDMIALRKELEASNA